MHINHEHQRGQVMLISLLCLSSASPLLISSSTAIFGQSPILQISEVLVRHIHFGVDVRVSRSFSINLLVSVRRS
jgi:hypothetical protein